MGYHWNDGGYSSEVNIYLVVDGIQYPVAQVGPESLVLRESASVRSGHAQLVITVDGKAEFHDVIIGAIAPCKQELAYA